MAKRLLWGEFRSPVSSGRLRLENFAESNCSFLLSSGNSIGLVSLVVVQREVFSKHVPKRHDNDQSPPIARNPPKSGGFLFWIVIVAIFGHLALHRNQMIYSREATFGQSPTLHAPRLWLSGCCGANLGRSFGIWNAVDVTRIEANWKRD